MSKSSKTYTTIEDEDFNEYVDDSSKAFCRLTKDESQFIEKKNSKSKNSSKSKRKNTSCDSTNNHEVKANNDIAVMNRLKHKGNKQWVHPPESLLRGHIVYNVKFLGHVVVDQPKGTEVIREAIRKMKFSKQLKKAEGQKPPRVELTISVDGVTIQDPKSKMIMHQYPLHRISYCADDKTDKRMLTFIAKEAETNKHECFVFDSDKCAEEITLSIGQAFDLAYRKFMDSSSKDMDMKKQYLLLQKKVQQLTDENLSLKAKVANLERQLDSKPVQSQRIPSTNEQPVVGRRLENLILDDQPYTNGTNDLYAMVQKPTSTQPATAPDAPVLAPPPPVPTRSNPGTPISPKSQGDSVDLFGLTPFNPVGQTNQPSIPPRLDVPPTGSTPVKSTPAPTQDPFGMGSFQPPTSQEIDQQIQNVDRELMDLQAGFSQGISFGTDDFSLADLDPLNQK